MRLDRVVGSEERGEVKPPGNGDAAMTRRSALRARSIFLWRNTETASLTRFPARGAQALTVLLNAVTGCQRIDYLRLGSCTPFWSSGQKMASSLPIDIPYAKAVGARRHATTVPASRLGLTPPLLLP